MKRNLFLMGLLASSVVYSQELSLNEVLEKARSSSHNVKSQEKLIEISELNAEAAKRGILPGLNLTAEADLSKLLKDEKKTVIGPQSIKAPVVVYAGGKIMSNFEKVENKLEMERVTLDEVKNSSEIEAIKLYFDILNIEKQIEISKSAKATLLKQKSRLDILFNSNKMISKNELLEIVADIKSVESEILLLESDLAYTRDKLSILIGLSDSNFTVKNVSVDSNEAKLVKVDIKSDIENLMKESNLAKKSQLEIENAKLDVKIAKAEFLPVVTVTPEYKFDSTDSTSKGFGLGINARMNIFSWGSTTKAVEAANRSVERKIEEKEESMKREISKVAAKSREIEMARESIKLAKERVEILEENSRIQSVRFASGLISSIDYLSSINNLRKAEEILFSREKDYILKNREYANLIK